MDESNNGKVVEAGREIRVLLVDDDELWVQSTAQLLDQQRDGFKLETATSLSAGRAAFDDIEPDCIVCDYELDEESGLDLLTEIREQDPERPFILITGQGSEQVASDAIGKQATDYIPKRSLGGHNGRLARRIETAVESYRTQQQGCDVRYHAGNLVTGGDHTAVLRPSRRRARVRVCMDRVARRVWRDCAAVRCRPTAVSRYGYRARNDR